MFFFLVVHILNLMFFFLDGTSVTGITSVGTFRKSDQKDK